tara:strand:- start:4855 stop:5037 length:183 start_codon:yes stop_codon:yes gene_type:complete
MIAIILQIIGFIALAYLAVKFAPNILNAVFKLSVIVVAFIIIAIVISLFMSDWVWSFNYV